MPYDDDHFDQICEAWEADERREVAEAFLNARFFDFFLHSDTAEMGDAVDGIFDELRKTHAAKTGHATNIKRCLKVVLANLVKHQAVDRERYTAYPRSYSGYPSSEFFNPLQVKWDGVKRIVDGLVELGHVTNDRGFYFSEYGHGMRSRMRATPHFIAELQRLYGLNAGHVQKHHSSRVLVLRDGNGTEIDFPGTKSTRRMIRELLIYNRRLRSTSISLDMPQEELDELKIDFGANQYHRVFNNGSFYLGGRFYGPWWVIASSELRKRMLIDGVATVECDYSGLHVHMLYSLSGHRYFDIHGQGDDPYQLPDYSTDYRLLIKKTVWALFGSVSLRGAKQSVRQWLPGHPGYGEVDVGDLIEEIQLKHKPIKEHFYSKPSLMLMYRDSKIASAVIKRMMKMGVMALPVHDSFVVQRQFEDDLRTVMVEEFRHNGFSSVPLITNNLSVEVAMEGSKEEMEGGCMEEMKEKRMDERMEKKMDGELEGRSVVSA